MIILIIANKIAPGIPRRLTKIIVKKLSPIWKLKDVPIKFIINIIKAPIIEFKKNFIINFKGTMKILHRMKIIHNPAK